MSGTAVYSNVVNIRLSPVELVLEFGFTVPGPGSGQNPRPGQSAFEPKTSVIMSIQALKPLAEMLAKAVDAQEKQTQQEEQQQREQNDASNTASHG